MTRTKLMESARELGQIAFAIVRDGLSLLLWVIGLTMVVYVVRLPFYDDSPEEFLRNAFLFSAIVMGSTLLFASVYWLFTKSAMVCVLLSVLLALSVVATCSSPFECRESRYVSCD
jgi:hypothetical protein